MEPAITVALWWLLFGGTHLAFATGRPRAWLVGRLGAKGFELFFSLVAAVTLGLLVHAYAGLRFEGAAGLALATVPGARTVLYGVAFAGMTLALWGVLAFPASPMAPPGVVRPPRGLARITRRRQRTACQRRPADLPKAATPDLRRHVAERRLGALLRPQRFHSHLFLEARLHPKAGTALCR